MQRWRAPRTGYQSDVLLQLGGHQLQAIAYGGITLPAIEQHDALVMAPGQGDSSPKGPLATLIAEREPVSMALPASLSPVPFAPITDDEITGHRELVFSADTPENDPQIVEVVDA